MIRYGSRCCATCCTTCCRATSRSGVESGLKTVEARGCQSSHVNPVTGRRDAHQVSRARNKITINQSHLALHYAGHVTALRQSTTHAGCRQPHDSPARLLVVKRKRDSIAPTLRDDLHRLLVRQRVDFKIRLLVYKRLHQLAPPYVVSLLTPVTAISARRHLPSADLGDLATPRTRTVSRLRSSKLLSCWSISVEQFAVAASELKNTSLTVGQFTSGQLKTEMFLCSDYESAEPSGLLDCVPYTYCG